MIDTVSQTFLDIVESDGRTFRAKLIIDDIEYTEFRELKLAKSCESGDSLSFGSCFSSTLDITISNFPKGRIVANKKATLYVGLKIDTSLDTYDDLTSYEWVKLGIFNISEAKFNDDELKIKAYDNFYLCEFQFTTNLSGLQKIKNIVSEQCNKFGIAFVDDVEDVSYNVDVLKGLTVREALSYLASYLGKNAIFNENGELQFIWYKNINKTIDSNSFKAPLTVGEYDTVIQSVTCITKETITDSDGNVESKDKSIVVGSGEGISFSNPYMTEARLNAIFNKVKDFTFRSCQIDWVVAEPHIQIGDIVTIEDGLNYYSVPIMEYEIDIDGGCNGTIKSKFKVEEADKFEGSLSKKVERNYQEYASFKEVITENIKAFDGQFVTINTDILNVNKELTSVKATIEDLDVSDLKAKVANIETSYVDKQYVNTNFVGIQYANQTYAVKSEVGDLSADVAKINTLLAGNTTAGSTQTIVLNAENTTIANALIKDAMIDTLNFNKITGVDINTTKFTIHSNDGLSTWKDNTILIKDASRTRVQIGKDSQGDYNIYIWDKDGKIMFDPLGLTADGINREVIDNSNVKENAGIAGSKLDIDSVITSINGSTTTIKSSKIKFDEKNQTLDVAFSSMSNTINEQTEIIGTVVTDTATAKSNASSALTKANTAIADSANAKTTANNAKSVAESASTKATTADSNASNALAKANALETKVTTVENTVKTQTTQINTANGQISTLITDVTQAKKDITTVTGDVTTAKANITTLTNNYTSVKQTVDGLSTTVGSHTSSIANLNTNLNNLEIGGRNLIQQSSFLETGKWTLHTSTSSSKAQFVAGYGVCKGIEFLSTATGNDGIYQYPAFSNVSLPTGKYILSMWIYPKKLGGSILGFNVAGRKIETTSGLTLNQWQFKSIAFTVTSAVTRPPFYLVSSGFQGIVSCVKLEKGNKATDWTPAPEDINSSIATVNNRITTEIKTVTDKQATFETNLNGITSRVSSTETKVTTVTNTVNGNKANWDKAPTALTNANNAQATANSALIGNKVDALNNSKLFKNIASYSNDSAGVKGAFVIVTPIVPAHMCRFRITGYNYVATTNNNIDITITCYNYASSIINCSYTNDGNVPFSSVRLAKVSSTDTRLVIILGGVTDTWQYPKLQVESALVSYSTVAPDTWKDGWSVSLVTTLSTAYAHLTTVSGMNIQTEITSTKSTVATHTTQINSIVSRVSTTETNITTINGNVASLTTRMSTAEQKVTDSAIVSTVTKSSSWTTLNTKATDAQTKANNLVDLTTIKDTRSVNNNPQWYFTNYPKKTVREFKTCTVIGITGEGTYGTLETSVSWAESSGGYPTQLFYPNTSQNIYRRVGTSTSTWGAWTKVAGTHNAISVINQTAESIKIQAAKIALEGLVTANSRFKILTDGSMEAVNGKFTGTITATSGNISGFTLASNRMYASSLSTFDFNVNDTNTIQNIIMSGRTPTTSELQRLDINGDGKLSASDYLYVQRIINAGNKITTNLSIFPQFGTGKDFTKGVVEVSVPNFGTTRITSLGFLYSSSANFDHCKAKELSADSFSFSLQKGLIENGDQGIEIWGNAPFIDFHHGNDADDYTSRLICYNNGELTCENDFRVTGTSYFTKSVRLSGALVLANAQYLYGIDTGGTWRWMTVMGDNNVEYFGDNSCQTCLRGSKVYLSMSGATVTSDRRYKNNIRDFDKRYENFFNELNPQTFRFNKDKENLTNLGFIAQDVQTAIRNSSLDENHNFVSKVIDEDGSELLGLVYEQFIALNTHMIQKNIVKIDDVNIRLSDHDKEIQELRNENARLQQELKNTQSKLDAFINGNYELKTVTREVA